ncbi:MAG: glutamate racemase [Spirochaetes bacterium]|nr:glutamate racemase [Spirochaetota bacterium]
MSIAFFDSGIGGITVLHEALKSCQSDEYIYYADTLNAPYGTKSKDEVRKFVLSAMNFITSLKVSAVVIACNTATSVAIEDIRKRYSLPIIGMEPAVKPAVEITEGTQKRVLVTATPLTLQEEKLKNLIDRVDNEHIVDLLPLPELVQFAENFEFKEDVVGDYLNGKLSACDLNKYGTIVLGCTHFIFYKNLFKKIIPDHIDVIDGNTGTINNLKKMLNLTDKHSDSKCNIKWYASGKQVYDIKKIAEFERLLLLLDSAEKTV